jgi:hypothetical protein
MVDPHKIHWTDHDDNIFNSLEKLNNPMKYISINANAFNPQNLQEIA